MSTKSTKTLPKPSNDLADQLRAVVGSDQLFSHHTIGQYTYTGFGGVAEILVVVKTTQELMEVARAIQQSRQPYVVIGAGSGSLWSDVGFNGVVIVNQCQALYFSAEASQVVVDAGYSLSALVNALASRGWGGMEFASAIPGTVGGAVATGASWQGKSVRNFVREVTMLVADGSEIKLVTVAVNSLPNQKDGWLFPLTGQSNPIILTVKFQVAALTQSEILRRVKLVRLGRRHFNQQMLGYVFLPSLSSLPLDYRRLAKEVLPRGISIDRNDTNILCFQPGRVLPNDLRLAIQAIEDYCVQNGYTVSQRLALLGYWPDRGESDESTKNT